MRACRSEGGKAWFCKIERLRAQSGKNEGQGEGEPEVEGSCMQKQGQQAPSSLRQDEEHNSKGAYPFPSC